MTNWRTGFAVSEAERIYWECAGTGVPIVICHGAGSNHVSLYQQPAGLAGDDYRVLLWDQRGYGNSTRNSRLVDISASAADVDAVLADVGLSEAPLHLVGQAMGGLVAGSWALAHPGRTLTLALWDGPFGLSADGKSLVWTLEPDDRGLPGPLGERHLGRVRRSGKPSRMPIRSRRTCTRRSRNWARTAPATGTASAPRSRPRYRSTAFARWASPSCSAGESTATWSATPLSSSLPRACRRPRW
jgi:pimeloyl-ACP methyl ester carboxylesterase